QPLAMPERLHAEFLQIRVSQLTQHCRVDIVVGECLRVLFEPESAEPSSDIHRYRHRYRPKLFPVERLRNTPPRVFFSVGVAPGAGVPRGLTAARTAADTDSRGHPPGAGTARSGRAP